MKKYTIKPHKPPPSFKNGKVITHSLALGRPLLITKPEHQKWMKDAVKQLVAQRLQQGTQSAQRPQKSVSNKKWSKTSQTVRIKVKWQSGRLADIDGIANTIMDCLVKAKLIADDSPQFVKRIEIEWERDEIDAVEIEIE